MDSERTGVATYKLAIAAGLITLCTACQTPSAAPQTEVPPTSTPAATASTAQTNTTTPVQEQHDVTPDCVTGQLDLTNSAATAPGLYRACVSAGTRVSIRIAPPVGAWGPLNNDAADTVEIVDQQVAPSGELTASLVARSAGTSTLSATSIHTGDPHGPPSYLWSLRLTVKP